jgi:hypothetical protein
MDYKYVPECWKCFPIWKTRESVRDRRGGNLAKTQQRMIIDRSLYGLKSSSARFHEHLSERLRKMDTYLRKQIGLVVQEVYYYEYVARFVDDVISFSKDLWRDEGFGNTTS